MIRPTVVSIQTGVPRDMGGQGDADRWRSAVLKCEVNGPVWVGVNGMDGDAQADQKNHSGPHRTVLAYALSHYDLWRAELGQGLPHGGFGENMTIDGLTEQDVCIGDVFRVGKAVLQVSEPRIPCWKIARRNGIGDLLQRVVETGRVGWFHRTLSEGVVEAGDAWHLLERPYPKLQVALVYAAIRDESDDMSFLAAAASCSALSPKVRDWFVRRVAALHPASSTVREEA